LFKVLAVVMMFILLLVAVAVWKGGAPFRAVGETTVAIGTAIVQIGDLVDELMGRKEEVKESIRHITETFKKTERVTGEEDTTEKKENGSAHQNKKPE
jgi:hypothetical protein